MAKYEVLGGTHDEDGKRYKKGDVVTTDRDLCKMFVNKFREVGSGSSKKGSAPSTSEDGDERGTNLTAEYSEAVDNNLAVFSKGGWCSVYDLEEDKDPNEAVNTKGLRKDDVIEFITSYLDDSE